MPVMAVKIVAVDVDGEKEEESTMRWKIATKPQLML